MHTPARLNLQNSCLFNAPAQKHCKVPVLQCIKRSAEGSHDASVNTHVCMREPPEKLLPAVINGALQCLCPILGLGRCSI